MDDGGIAVGFNHNEFQQSSGPVWSDDQYPISSLLRDMAHWQADRVTDVFVGDPVFPGAVRDLHATYVTSMGEGWATFVAVGHVNG